MPDIQYLSSDVDALISGLNTVYESSLIKFLQAANVPYVMDESGIDFFDAEDTYIPGTTYQINAFSYHLIIKFIYIFAAKL